MSGIEATIALQQSRFSLIQAATDFDASQDGPPRTRQLVNTQLEVLEQNWGRFQKEHDILCHTENDQLNEHPYIQTRVYERCQAFYVYSRAKLLTLRDELESSDRRTRSEYSDAGATAPSMPRIALPRINLPTFSGDYKLWRSFHDLFGAIIRDNADLSDVEKMHYLKTCVTGEASRLISNLPISRDNFTIAWEMLVSRYENKRFLVTAELNKLTNLKPLKTKSAQGLSSLLTTISESIGALRALGCSVHHWDPLLLHHLVRLLDPETREAWEVNLGLSSSYPTFIQFEEFLIARTRALENINLHDPAPSSSRTPSMSFSSGRRSTITAHVATLDSSECPLCGSEHYWIKCPRYQSKTPQQRRDAIIQYRRCFNCLGSHAARTCPSTRRCQKCGGKHHTSIHGVHNEPSLDRSKAAQLDTEAVGSMEERPSQRATE